MSTIAETPRPPKAPKNPQFIFPKESRTTAYKPRELYNKLVESDKAFTNQPPDKTTSQTYLEELYAFMKDIDAYESDSKDPKIAELERRFNYALIRTEINRVRHQLYHNERSKLSNTRELAEWQITTTEFIRNIRRAYDFEESSSIISQYWGAQERIFTAALPGMSDKKLKEQFERQKHGALAAVAFEESLSELDDWTMQPGSSKLDAERAIDYVIESPRKNTFLVQLTSTRESNIPAAACMQIMEKHQPSDMPEKQGRFWRGARHHIIQRNLDPSIVRTVFITLSQEHIDPNLGIPTDDLRDELEQSLDSIDARGGGWTTASHPRLPR
jgi:hypothetical protein